MKSRIIYLTSVLMGLVSYQAYSQLDISPKDRAQCPGVALLYTVTNSINAACAYDWVVTNGTIQGGSQSGSTSTLNNAGTIVTITWSNVSTAGSINVTAKNCTNASGNANRVITAPILSLNGINPGTVTGSPGATAVQINSTPNLVYTVPQIQYPNRGSLDPNPYNITTYEWEIPSGWSVVSGGTSNTITVRADNCSAGSVRVRGKASCSNGNFFSNWSSPLAITRTFANPGAIAGPASVNCTDITTKTFSITAVPGATSYTWTFPSGWTGTSTTPSITLTPNGLNAGTITVRANGCSLQSAVSSLPIAITLTNPNNPPSVSGASTVCFSGASFSLSNFPASSTVNWTQSSNLTTISGQGTTTYTVRGSASNTSGAGWVEAVITTPCGLLPAIRYNSWVGTPGITNQQLYAAGSYGVNPVSLYPGNIYSFQMETVPGASFYTWLLPDGFSFWGSGGNSTSQLIQTPYQEGVYILGCAAENICGTGGAAGLAINLSVGGGGGVILRVSPNPTKDEITLEIDKDQAALRKLATRANIQTPLKQNDRSSDSFIEYTINDSNGNIVMKSSTKSQISTIDLRTLKKGIYIVTVSYENTVERHRIVLE